MSHAGEYPDTTLTTPVRLALAAAILASVALLESALGPLVDVGSHFLLMGTAVLVVALTAGTLPAALATIGGVALSLGDADVGGAHRTNLLLFVAQAFILTVLVAALHDAQHAARVKSREAERALREGESATRLKDEFLATISHELRTPLNAVLGWVHLLRSGKLDARMSDQGLDSIERNVRRQAEMTGELLDASKAMTGRLRVDCHVLPLESCVREAAEAARPAAHAKAVQIITKIPGAPIPVLADPDRLRQIVWHLLANAIKFTPRGGRVDLTVESTGDQARLIVRDTGPGIDPAFLPRIFERFAQQDASTTRTAGGLGVGLALVRELVALHGGTITAANAQDGTGAVMTASFPVQSVELTPLTDALPTAMSAPALLEGLRVLVFDEDADARDLLRTVLKQRGAVVRTAGSVGEALEALESWRPDVLVSDDVTSDHDYYSLVAKVQTLESDRGGRIPALVLTSVARTDGRLRELLNGKVSCVPKPFEPVLLTAEIARLAGREPGPVQH
jgi:signal transduction histidine kinase/CheY-like chemotaxis protein